MSNDEQSITQIQQALFQGEIDVVSDGSFCPIKGLGAAGWVIETKELSAQLTGSKGTVGPKSSQNACQSEMTGIMYALLHLKLLCNNLILAHVKIILHCDNLSAIQSITNAPKDIFFTFDLQYIKGHQDNSTAYHRLSNTGLTKRT